MLSFPLPPREPRQPPPFQRPKTLITFSYDETHQLLIDSISSLRYYAVPPQRADLNFGYEAWIKRPEERGRLDSLLKCLEHERVGNAARRPSVVAWRGVITKIVTAPYEGRDGWELNAMLVNGMIYLEEHTTAAKLREKQDLTPQHRLFSYYGYSFESYCTKSNVSDELSQDSPQGWGGTVNTNVQFCHVVKTKLGTSRLIMGGEVDCAKDRYSGQTNCLMELKTSIAMKSARDEANFERKLLKFWAQSYLLGIPEILVGFRTPAGILTSLQSIPTLDIPRQVRTSSSPGPKWDAGLALDFAERFLAYLRETMTSSQARRESDSTAVWRLSFIPGIGEHNNNGKVDIQLLTDKSELDYVDGGGHDDRVGFLPRAFFEAANADLHRDV